MYARLGSHSASVLFHLAAPTLDVDWRNHNTFATCSADKHIHVCKIGDDKPLKTFTGHEDEVRSHAGGPTAQVYISHTVAMVLCHYLDIHVTSVGCHSFQM
eukprot:GHUV01050890.1.p2 GENE.GHUV01050890.1~~GHUV01050890.1.p2  ORF type:complete len:101 (-),score=22.64 GHUV01050890.1:367-669(-)